MRYIIRRYRSATWKSIRISRRRDIMYTRRHSCTKHTQPRVMLFNKNSSQHYTHHSHHTYLIDRQHPARSRLCYMLDSRHKIYKKLLLYTSHGRVQWVVTGVLYIMNIPVLQSTSSPSNTHVYYIT